MIKKTILMISALLCAATSAQTPLAVYVMARGHGMDDITVSLRDRLNDAINKSDEYIPVAREDLWAALDREVRLQGSNFIAEETVSDMFSATGAKHVCVVTIGKTRYGIYEIIVRILDVTTKTYVRGRSTIVESQLRNQREFNDAAREVMIKLDLIQETEEEARARARQEEAKRKADDRRAREAAKTKIQQDAAKRREDDRRAREAAKTRDQQDAARRKEEKKRMKKSGKSDREPARWGVTVFAAEFGATWRDNDEYIGSQYAGDFVFHYMPGVVTSRPLTGRLALSPELNYSLGATYGLWEVFEEIHPQGEFDLLHGPTITMPLQIYNKTGRRYTEIGGRGDLRWLSIYYRVDDKDVSKTISAFNYGVIVGCGLAWHSGKIGIRYYHSVSYWSLGFYLNFLL